MNFAIYFSSTNPIFYFGGKLLILIVPSALLVPVELQNLGKIPSIIYPVEGKMVFQYIYQIYHDICSSIKIICGEGASQVHNSLKNYKRLQFEDIPENEIKDLGYTIYRGIQNEDQPIIINFGDTIVEEDITKANSDAFFYSEDAMSGKWTFFEEDNGRINKIYDKTQTNLTARGKLFVGVFLIKHTQLFRMCLEEAFIAENRIESTFYYALRKYSEEYPLKSLYTTKWFDIGHLDKYYNTKMEVKAREFNHITIDRNRGILRKTSDNKEKFIGEIKWYLKLPADIEYVSPRIFSYSTAYEKPYISMEYYDYHTVHELFLYSDLDINQWIDIFSRIKFVINDFKRYTLKDEKITSSLEDIYLVKTLQRFATLQSDERFKNFFEKPIVINGIKYKSLTKIQNILQNAIPSYLYDVDEFTIIHGDLCFANILVDSNFSFIKLIDPRGKFGTFDIYGDPRYELAKLFHSIDGKYDYIIKDLFDLTYNTFIPQITYSIHERNTSFDLYGIFKEVFRQEIGPNITKIQLIESLLFLSMIPLHNENFNHQMAMLATGLDILNRVIDITESA